MTKDQYLEMCNQTGQEIDWEKCPPDWEDFPQVVIDAIYIFHSMPIKYNVVRKTSFTSRMKYYYISIFTNIYTNN